MDARVVHQDVNVLELRRQRRHKVLDLLGIADVQLDRQDLDAVTDLLLDVLRQLIQRLETPRRHDQLEVLGRGARKLLRGAAANARRCAGHDDRLAFEALCHCGSHCASEESRLGDAERGSRECGV